jgi:hypothetical protein
MSARKSRPAALEYSVLTRSDRPPRIGDTLQLGKQEYEVVSLRVRVELRPVSDVSDAQDDDE